MSGHTPGPWRFHEEDVDVHDGSYTEPMVITETDEHGRSLAIAAIRVGVNGTQANWHLIAAAPDLLKACKMADAYIEMLGDGELTKTRTILRAAIQKSETAK